MKKLLLGLGTLAAIAAPVTSIIACGSGTTDKTEKIKIFSFGKNSSRQQLIYFINKYKGQNIIVKIDGQDFEFKSDGILYSDLDEKVYSYLYKIEKERRADSDRTDKDKVTTEETTKTKEAQELADKTKEAQELADKKEKVEIAQNNLLAIDISNAIRNLNGYSSTDDVASYNIPSTIDVTKNNIVFEAQISDISKDGNKGKISFKVKVVNSLAASPKIFNNVFLTGFKTNLDNKHKIAKIQNQLDSDDTVTISSTIPSAENDEADLSGYLEKIVSNDYGISKTITNIVFSSGQAKFVVTYSSSDESGNVLEASKKITINGFLSDEAKANELQQMANSLKMEEKRWLNSSTTYLKENEAPVGQGKVAFTEDLFKKIGLDNYENREQKLKKLLDKNVKCEIEIDKDTMMAKFFVSYRGSASTLISKEIEIYTYQKNAFYNSARTRESQIGYQSLSSIRTTSFPIGFKLPKGLTELPDYSLAMYDIPSSFKIPSTIKKIGDYAFVASKIPDGFTIPDSVSEIGDCAFRGASIPKTFKFSSSIDEIGNGLFSHATVADGFVIPENIKSIRSDAFNYAKIGKNFQLPKKLDLLEEGAFEYTTIGNGFVMPELIKKVDLNDDDYYSIFSGATLPSFIDVSKLVINSIDNGKYLSLNDEKIDCLFDGIRTIDGIIPNYVSTLKSNMLSKWIVDPLPSDFKIPNNIKTIGTDVFNGKVMPDGFEIPDSVTRIESRAFIGAEFHDGFKIPSKVTYIGAEAFMGIYRANSDMPSGVTIPDSVTFIGEGAFAKRNFKAGFKIGSGVKTLRGGVFLCSKFADDFILPDTVDTLLDQPFLKSTTPDGFGANTNAIVETSPYGFNHPSSTVKMALKGNY